jgi:hypothetical protein
VIKKRGNRWWVVVYAGRDPLASAERNRSSRDSRPEREHTPLPDGSRFPSLVEAPRGTSPVPAQPAIRPYSIAVAAPAGPASNASASTTSTTTLRNTTALRIIDLSSGPAATPHIAGARRS